MKALAWTALALLLAPLVIASTHGAYSEPRAGFSASTSVSVDDTAVYTTGYVSQNGSEWAAFTLSGSKERGDWVLGTASSDVDLSGMQYVAIFSCTWNNDWDCSETWQVYDRGEQAKDPDLPVVHATAPEDITTDSATMQGRMTRFGKDGQAQVWFEWREEGASEWQTTSQQTKDDPHTFQHALAALSNSTLYEYRVVAQNSVGTTRSAPHRFTTLFPASGGSIQGDYQALQDLYAATNGDGWYDNTGWPDMTPETMGQAVGITTGPDGRVTEIDMQSPRTEGQTQLGNNLVGTLPESIGNLNRVTHLRLKTNQLTGPIPETIGDMTSLQWLALGGQRCDVDLADHQWNENNHRMCPDEDSKEWQETNSLSGPIPASIGNLKNLRLLEIRRQYLTGTIPSEIGQLTNLVGLFLNDQKGDNPLGGALPPEMGNLVNLKHLHLDSRSNDNGGFTHFPDEINTGLKEIRHIRTRDNQLTGTMPGFPNAYDLRVYVMSHNQFTGGFPINLFQGEHFSLNNFLIAQNNLTGEIPTNFIPPRGRTNYHSMSKFGIGGNDFTGEIPDWIQDMSGHQVWDANGASFSGPFPDLVMDQDRLKTFMFAGNNLSGPLPDKEWASERMLTIYAQDNHFNGSIPDEWQSLTKSSNRMWILYLQNNDLSGLIPAWLADIEGIERIALDGNKFTPKDILPHWDAIYANAEPRYTRVLPQDPFGKAYTASAGETLDYSSEEYTGNTYQWLKDGAALSGETAPTIDTTSYGVGEYVLEIEHPDLDFTFTSEPITVQEAQTDSRSGDEEALEALSASVDGLDASWDTPISLESPPTGVSVESIDGELRVTQINLRAMGLGGSIDVPELANLKELTLWNSAQNRFDTQYPAALHQATNLEYLYITYPQTNLEPDEMPHDQYANQGGITYTNVGKTHQSEESIIRGVVPDDIDNLQKLKWFYLTWTDDWGPAGTNREEPVAVNGIQDVSQNIWNIPTLEAINIYENWNIAGSGNDFQFPDTISHTPNFAFLYAGGGSGTRYWDADEQGFMAGTYSSDMDQLTKLRALVLSRNAQLTGFPDFRNSLDFEYLVLTQSDTKGTMPPWMWDGRFNRLDVFSISAGPFAENRMTGTFPPIDPDSYGTMDLFNIKDHAFNGTFPEGLFLIDTRKFNIGQNHIQKLGRTDMTHMVHTTSFNAYRNDIEGQRIIKLDWSRLDAPGGRKDETLAQQFARLRFEGNRYVFEDMLYVPDNAPNGEPAIELFWKLADQGVTINFQDQEPAGPTNTYTVGGDIVIDDHVGTYGHPDNSYQWQKDGVAISDGSKYSGTNTKTLTITNSDSGDVGTYELVVTNSLFSSLADTYGQTDQTLRSRPITVVSN